jgi:hypothetical protein
MNTYTFTGYYPSGNPFRWLYDEHRHTMFTTSLETNSWKKQPKIGDKCATDEKGDWYINGELVSDNSEEANKEAERNQNKIYNELLISKGFSKKLADEKYPIC